MLPVASAVITFVFVMLIFFLSNTCRFNVYESLELLETVEEDDPSSPASHHLATAMGVKSHRMQVMKASFFGEPEIEEHQSYSPIPSKGIYPASPSRAAGRYHKERKTGRLHDKKTSAKETCVYY